MDSMNVDLDSVHDLEALRAAAKDAAAENVALKRDKQKLENEVIVLLARLADLTRALAAAKDEDAQLALELQLKIVREQLATLNDEKFGPSRSERRGRPEGEERPKPAPKPKTGHGPTRKTICPSLSSSTSSTMPTASARSAASDSTR